MKSDVIREEPVSAEFSRHWAQLPPRVADDVLQNKLDSLHPCSRSITGIFPGMMTVFTWVIATPFMKKKPEGLFLLNTAYVKLWMLCSASNCCSAPSDRSCSASVMQKWCAASRGCHLSSLVSCIRLKLEATITADGALLCCGLKKVSVVKTG